MACTTISVPALAVWHFGNLKSSELQLEAWPRGEEGGVAVVVNLVALEAASGDDTGS